MTNQTIDGVPRELLASFAAYVADSPNAVMRSRAAELRALLDAPARPAEFKKIEMAHVMNALEDVRGKPVLTSNQCHDLARALNDRLLSPLQLLAMPAEYLAAAQPQGEPVAWVECSPAWLKAGGDCANAPRLCVGRNGISHLHPAHAEQPAPVAVVMPDRLNHSDGLHTYEYVTGHNAAIEKMFNNK